MTDLPLSIGAALTLPDLPDHLDWLREGNRDLEIQDFCDPGPLPADWRERVEKIRSLLDGWSGRLGLHGPFYGLDLATPDPDVRKVVQHRLDERLDVCATLGADQMVIHSPVTTWHHFNRHNSPGGEAALLERLDATLRPALRRAESQGVELVLENIEDADPLDRLRLVTALGSPALHISLDTGHAHYAHTVTQGPPVDYYVAAAGVRLAHVHLQDADGRADRHWAPGQGTVPWGAVFAALARLDARPRLVLELADARKISEGFQWLVSRGLAA